MNKVTSHLNEMSDLLLFFKIGPVIRAAKLLNKTRTSRNRVYLIGNGGSAATAMHFANDLKKMCHIDALALPGEIATITAYGNDNGWERMYADYLSGTFRNGDVLVAISCSGASKNIVTAARMVEMLGGHLIILTGKTGKNNELAQIPGVTISVDSDNIRAVEDAHLVICHSIAGALAK